MDIKSLITEPIAEELKQFNILFDDVLKSSNKTLHNVFSQLLQSKGKMMRPVLLLLLSKGLGKVSEISYHAALSLELLHTASLVHDDVVDESSERRGMASVNKAFGNKVAVLSGDFILSTALAHAAMTNSTGIVQAISELGKALSEGELLQLYNSQSLNFSEETYIEIISKKTASLFVTCTECAAISVNTSPEIVEKCREFGRMLGIAFQIKDDIFDYFDSKEIGKPTGNDMRECKLTLPALYVINTLKDKRMISIANEIKKGTATDGQICEMIAYTKDNGGIDYAERVMDEYLDRAKSVLEIIRYADVRRSLELYLDYISNRSH